MEKATREQFLDCLQTSWQHFVAHFYSLPPQEQLDFLAKQGYAAFPDLLAHVVAWWQDGSAWIKEKGSDPSLPLPEIDVDAFNAAAVKKFAAVSTDEMIRLYESQRRAIVELVSSLPETILNYDNVNLRLYYEILSHWKEHELN